MKFTTKKTMKQTMKTTTTQTTEVKANYRLDWPTFKSLGGQWAQFEKIKNHSNHAKKVLKRLFPSQTYYFNHKKTFTQYWDFALYCPELFIEKYNDGKIKMDAKEFQKNIQPCLDYANGIIEFTYNGEKI